MGDFPEEVSIIGYPAKSLGEYVYHLLAAAQEPTVRNATKLFFGLIQCPTFDITQGNESLPREETLVSQFLATEWTMSGGFIAFYGEVGMAAAKLFSQGQTQPLRMSSLSDGKNTGFAMRRDYIGTYQDINLSWNYKYPFPGTFADNNKVGCAFTRDEFLAQNPGHQDSWDLLRNIVKEIIKAGKLQVEKQKGFLDGQMGGAIVSWRDFHPFVPLPGTRNERLNPTRPFLRAAIKEGLVAPDAIISPSLG